MNDKQPTFSSACLPVSETWDLIPMCVSHTGELDQTAKSSQDAKKNYRIIRAYFKKYNPWD